MKKVGIMTWYKYRNYGTALQCAALFQNIKQLGYEPSLISYNTSVNKYVFPERESMINTIKSFVQQRLDSTYSSCEKEKLFNEFLENRIVETDLRTNYSDLYYLNQIFDAFVCGSDQIWSPTRSFDDKYYLSFVKDGKKKISYAPSFGTSEINNPEQKKVIKLLLERFDYLSVREQKGAEIVEDLIGKKPEIVLDPTLLLNTYEWDDYCCVDSIKKIASDYILCYFLGNQKKYIKNVQQISKTMGVPYYIIPISNFQAKQSYKVPFEVGPAEFVSLIKNAKYVCTDSFHGMAFAINYNIPFTIYKRFSDKAKTSENSRIYNLLDMFNMQSRLNEDCYLNKIDYKSCNEKLEKLRYKSKEYLLTALSDNSKLNDNKSINHLTSGLCSGCGACQAVCSKKAITVQDNEYGFLHYRIDHDKCIDCGACTKVCPILNNASFKLEDALSLYAYKSEDKNVLLKSSSGGAAYAIARLLLNKGYLICGSTYDVDSERAKHIIIKNEKQLEKLQGSKYIQSDTTSCFEEILQYGGKIAYFGMPCQVAGLDNLLRIKGKRENVILIDLVCHGIPSLNIWKKYLGERKKEINTKESLHCVFRNKEYSWREKVITFTNKKNKQLYAKNEAKDDYYAFFNRPIAYMYTCYECQFREKTSADIRIGDFWGEQYKMDKTGVSLVVANTEKGSKVVRSILNVNTKEHPVKEYWNSQYVDNPQKPIFYIKALTDMADSSISMNELKNRYCSYYVMRERTQKYKNIVYSIIRLFRK